MTKSFVHNIFDFITKGNQRSVSVKKNIIGTILIKGVSIITSLIIVPVTLGYVNSEIYGIWLTLATLLFWINFFDVGFSLGLKNKLATALADNNYEKGKEYVSTTYIVMVFIFAPLCLIVELILPYFDWSSIMNVNSDYENQILTSLRIIFVSFSLQVILNTITAVVSAYQKVALSSSFYILGNVISLFLIIFARYFLDPSLIILASFFSITPLVTTLVATFWVFSSICKDVRPSLRYISTPAAKEIFNLGAKFFLIQIQCLVLYQSTSFLISHISGPKDVTSYNIAYRYLSAAMMVFNLAISPLWPAFTDAYAKKDFLWMNKVYNKMLRGYYISAILIIILVIISPYVYAIWIGNSVSIPKIITILVGIYLLIITWNGFPVQLLNGIGAIKLQTYITMVGMIVFIPLSLFLGSRWYTVGIISSMIIVNFSYSFFYTIQIRKILSQKASGIWLQ